MKKRHIILFLPLVITLLLVAFFSAYWAVKKKTLHDFNRQQQLLAQQAATGIQDFFEQHLADLAFLASLPDVIALNARGEALLNNYQRKHGDAIQAVTRVDASGRIVFTGPSVPELIGRDISYQAHIKTIMETHEPVISDVFSAVQGFDAVAYHHPVFDGHRYAGSLALLISFNRIAARYIENIRIGDSGYAWVISEKGVELYCPVPGHVGKTVQETSGHFPSVMRVAEKMMAGEKGVDTYEYDRIRENRVEHVRKHAVYHPIHLGNTFWSIIVAAPEKEIFACMGGFRNRLMLIAGLFLLVGLVYFYWTSRKLAFAMEGKKRLKVEQALEASEARFQSYVNHAPHGIFLTDEKGRYMDVNPAACEMTGYHRDELLTMSIMDLVPPEGKEAGAIHFQTVKESGFASGDGSFQKKEGTKRIWQIDAVALTDQRFLAFTQDVTDIRHAASEIKKQLKEKEILLKEIHHRVKNNLNVISSLLNLQAREVRDDENAYKAFMDSIQRVHSMALVHERLYGSDDFLFIQFRHYAQTLTKELGHIYQVNGRIRLIVDVEDVEMDITRAIPCGLILNELVTNALKHAFAENETGQVEVRFTREADEYRLSVKDNGSGMPAEVDYETGGTLGLLLVRILTDQLQGKLAVTNDAGLAVTVRFPGRIQ